MLVKQFGVFKSLFYSSVKAGPVQPGRHGARETVSRPRSWEDILIFYKQIYMDECQYRKRNSLGNTAISWLNCAIAQMLSKHLSSDFWLEGNLSFLFLLQLKMTTSPKRTNYRFQHPESEREGGPEDTKKGKTSPQVVVEVRSELGSRDSIGIFWQFLVR